MERMEEDRRAVLLLGFFRTVTTAQRTVDGKTSVTFRLVEWPQVAHLRVLGNSVVDRRTLLESISTQLGQVLCAPQLVDDIHAIEQLYRERGYVAQVSQRILDEATSTGILKFEILEVQVAEIKFEGGDAALQERCRKALRELPPRLYRPEAVTIDQARLLRVKGIRRADPKVEPITPGKVRIRWQLEGLPSRATATVTQSALRASM